MNELLDHFREENKHLREEVKMLQDKNVKLRTQVATLTARLKSIKMVTETADDERV